MTPTRTQFVNHVSARREHVFTKQEIKRLLVEGCVEEVHQIPTVCSPLSVVTD